MFLNKRYFPWLAFGIFISLLSYFVITNIHHLNPSNPTLIPMATSTELIHIIENVPDATAYRYGATDSAGHVMDTAKIIADPAGGYLAVYHALAGSFFQTHLATSTDLINWTYQQTYGDRTHQPYLTALPKGGFVLANEADNGSYNWIQMRYYASRADLLANNASRTYNVPHTLVPAGKWAEGTPNIYSVTLNPDIDHSTIEVGFHYYKNGDVDRQARGTLTNFDSWSSHTEPAIDNAMLAFGLRGNIGDRDYLVFRGETFNIHEGQSVKNDFGSWRLFFWDWATGTARQLTVQTHGGSLSFANPSLTLVPAPGGGQALVVSIFIPSENSAAGEAGQLIYYKIIPEYPSATE
jgi:hypothetical protein